MFLKQNLFNVLTNIVTDGVGARRGGGAVLWSGVAVDLINLFGNKLPTTTAEKCEKAKPTQEVRTFCNKNKLCFIKKCQHHLLIYFSPPTAAVKAKV